MRYWLITVSMIVVLIVSMETNAQQVKPLFKATLLSPVEEGKPFWHEFETVMKVAAKQLNIELTIERLIYEEHNRFSVYDRYKTIADGKSPPDYFISFLQRRIEVKTFELFERCEQNFISVNTGISPSVKTKLGLPQHKFKHWIGHVSPDDHKAGKVLMEQLHNLYAKQKNTPARLLAFSGPSQSEVANQRLDGLNQAIKELNHTRTKVKFLQALPTPWRGEVIKEKTRTLLTRHGIPDIIWTPSDLIATDVISELKGQTPQPLIGSFDWSPEGLELVERGLIDVNMGGHFLDGAWALVLAFDHFHNHKYHASETGIFNTEMYSITKGNIGSLRDKIEQTNWDEFDFVKHTKHNNPEVKKSGYDFSIEPYLN